MMNQPTAAISSGTTTVGTADPRLVLRAERIVGLGDIAATAAMALASSGLAPADSSKRTASWVSDVVFMR